MDWYEGMPGKFLFAQEKAQWATLLLQQTGLHIVQISGAVDMLSITTCPIAHQIRIDREKLAHQYSSFVKANLFELPLLINSVDVIFLPHVLEFLRNPQLLLNESFHALASGGRLIILGFNPWSPWAWMRPLCSAYSIPKSTYCWSISRVKSWLREIGFTKIVDQTFCFRPPVASVEWYERLLFMEAAGSIITPGMGAVYLIMAEKPSNSCIPLQIKRWSKKMSGAKKMADSSPRSNIAHKKE